MGNIGDLHLMQVVCIYIKNQQNETGVHKKMGDISEVKFKV